MLCRCSTMSKDHFLEKLYCTKWSLCADVPLNPHSFLCRGAGTGSVSPKSYLVLAVCFEIIFRSMN